MKFARALRRTAALLAVGLVISCGLDQSPTAPPPPQADLLGGLVGGTVGTLTKVVGSLLTCSPMPMTSDSALIGPDGGTLDLGSHRFVVPRGALKKTVMISAVAPRDTVNSVRFSPEGLKFDRSAQLVMSYSNCNLVAGLLTPKRIAYTTDGLRVLSYVPSSDNILARKVTGQIDHFSRYAVGW